MKQNKVFQIELCQEDAQRIINSIELYKDHCKQLIDQCVTEEQKSTAWLEWSYVSELLYMVEDKFDVNHWSNGYSVEYVENQINV